MQLYKLCNYKMANYTITYACGHEGTVNLYGSYDERDRKIAWLETQDCPHCKKAQLKAKVDSITEEKNLPELSGSEKQIAWAKEIRALYVEYYDTIAQNEKISKPEMLTVIRDWLVGHTDSKFWIDNRSYFCTDRCIDDNDGSVRLFLERLKEIYLLLYKPSNK